jgi:tetratricopeptide (TPR) repeat protein
LSRSLSRFHWFTEKTDRKSSRFLRSRLRRAALARAMGCHRLARPGRRWQGSGVAMRGPLVLLWLALTATGCARAPVPSPAAPSARPPTWAPGPHLDPKTKKSFAALLEEMARHDQARDWTLTDCQTIAQSFDELAGQHLSAVAAEGRYNAAVALSRCGTSEAVRAAYRKAAAHADRHGARAQLWLLLDAAEHTGATETTLGGIEGYLKQVLGQDPEALVLLAGQKLQMLRADDVSGFEATAREIEAILLRALGAEPDYPPAINQLALLLLERARHRAASLVFSGSGAPAGRSLGLMLALEAVERGLAVAPNHAPLHNTAGLIHTAAQRYGEALEHFSRAQALDPGLVAAHFNHAALAFALRAYHEAVVSYAWALSLEPSSYDARLGLALALAKLAPEEMATAHGAWCTWHEETARLAPLRPEAYFNAAVVVQDLMARRVLGTREAVVLLTQSALLLQAFLDRADPVRHGAAIRLAEERLADLRDLGPFVVKSR